MTADPIRPWFEGELRRRGRAAQASDDMFPLKAWRAPDAAAPASAREARDFYCQACFDWGAAWIFRAPIGAGEVYFVYAGTDGDDAWLEIFDAQGALLDAASLSGSSDDLRWEPRDAMRARLALE